MKVFRYMCEEELEKILQNRVDELGSYFKRVASNNHKYKSNEKYMHFFLSKNAYKHLAKNERPQKHFLCEFDIPFHVLMQCAGKGVYRFLNDQERGYKTEGVFRHRVEFAIESSIFRPQWLKKYKKIEVDNEKIK